MAELTTLDALRVTPAHHLREEMAAAEVTGERSVKLTELPFPVQIGLRAELNSPSAEALESVLGYPLPTRVGEVTGRSDRSHTFWLSPDEFLVVDTSRRHQPRDAEDLIAALEGLPGHAVDLSANRTVFEFSGRASREALEKVCNADLHEREFRVGEAITTAIAHIPVILHRVQKNQWRIYPRASFADFVARWLIDAMQEYRQDEVL